MKFKEFARLEESLDTTANFYMTQDTDLPNRVVAAFNYDGGDYVMDMAKFIKEGLYIMDLGLIVSKNKGYFRFKNASHIKPVLGTTMKALEASIPFLGANIKGLAISLPSKVSKNYVDLMKLLMQKTYLRQQFDFLPINHIGNSHQYLLLVRKGVDPKTIFKTKTFKDYGLNDKYTKDTPVPTDALDDLKPVKAHKISYDLTPSTKYQYKGYDITEPSIDNIHDLVAAKPVINKKVEKNVEIAVTAAVEKHVNRHGEDKKPEVTAEIEKTKQSLFHGNKMGFIAKSENGSGLVKRLATAFGPVLWTSLVEKDNVNAIEEYVNKNFSTDKFKGTLNTLKDMKEHVVSGGFDEILNNQHYTPTQIGVIKQAWEALDTSFEFFTLSDGMNDVGNATMYKNRIRQAIMLYKESHDAAMIQHQSSVVDTAKPQQSKIKSISNLDKDEDFTDEAKRLAIAFGDLYIKNYVDISDVSDDMSPDHYMSAITYLKQKSIDIKNNVYNELLAQLGYSSAAIVILQSYNDEIINTHLLDANDNVHTAFFYRLKFKAAYRAYNKYFKNVVVSDVPEQPSAEEVATQKKKNEDFQKLYFDKEKAYQKSEEHFEKVPIPNSVKNLTDQQTKLYENMMATALGETFFAQWKNESEFAAWQSGQPVSQLRDVIRALIVSEYVKLEMEKLPYLSEQVKETIKLAVFRLANSGIFSDLVTDQKFSDIVRWAYFRFRKYFVQDGQKALYDGIKGTKTADTAVTSKVIPTPKIKTVEEPNSHMAVDVGITFQPVEGQENLENTVDARMNVPGGYSPTTIAENIQKSAAYKSLAKKMDENYPIKAAVHDYTGSGYHYTNHRLRKIFNPDYETNGYGDTDDYDHKIKILQKLADEAVPLETGIWVFRNCNVKGISLPNKPYDVNEEIVDAGFLSTSLSSSIFAGKNTRFMIYLPKGSKVIPILSQSSQGLGEFEIVLPAMSVLRPIDVAVYDNKQYVKCIYIGNAGKSFIDKNIPSVVEQVSLFRKFKEYRVMTEEEKKKEPDPVVPDPYRKGDLEFASQDMSRKIMELIKKGVYKIKK